MKNKTNQILNISKYVLGLLGVVLCVWLVASDYPDSDAELWEIDTFITGIYEVQSDGESLTPLAIKYVDTAYAKRSIIDAMDSKYKEIFEDYVLNKKSITEISKKHKLDSAETAKRILKAGDILMKEMNFLVMAKETEFVKNWKTRKEQKIKDLKNSIKNAESEKEKEKLNNELANLKSPKIIKTDQKLKNGGDYIIADPQTIQLGDDIDIGKSYSFSAINYVIYVIGLALLGVIAFFIYALIIRPKKTAVSILGLIISASVFLILFFIGSSDTLKDLQIDPESVNVGANTIDITSAGIYTIGICLFIGVLAIVLGPFMGRYRRY